jgi:hypothetical protein
VPIPTPPSKVSARLRRAAVAERAQLVRDHERIERARAGVEAELERLERELAGIDQHLELLVRIAPAGDDETATHRNPDTPQHRNGSATLLNGPAIRATAVRVLIEHRPRVEAIHYRDWYALVVEHGFAVAGKKPLAVFLSQVSRSPVMRRGTSAGVYAVDRGAPERLRRELAELERALSALTGRPPGRRADGDLHARRRELVRAIDRHERALHEAVRCLERSGSAAPSA